MVKKWPFEEYGFYLCAKCGKPACSVDPDKRDHSEFGSKLYCPKCGAWYCARHWKDGGRAPIAAGTDAEIDTAICPKKHDKPLFT
ncbi:hypothetical protein ACFL4W_02845 [Planctomycetota bacterium]